MSNRLFDPNEMVAVVTSDAGAPTPWTIGHDLQDQSGAFALSVSDTCTVDDDHLIAGEVDAAPGVYNVKSFGAVVQALRNVRCANGEEQEIVTRLLQDGAATAAAEYALWFGVPGWDLDLQPSLANNDVVTVAAGTSVVDTIAAAVIRRAQLTVADKYLVHMGVKAALELSATGGAYSDGPDPVKNQLRLRAVDAPIVVSPYYPADGIAVTGPVVVRVTAPSSFQSYDISTNRTAIRGYELIEIDFNPSTSVRVV